MSSSNPIIPDDVQSREGMALYLILHDIRNEVHGHSKELKDVKNGCLSEEDIKKLRADVAAILSVYDGAVNTGKKLIWIVAEKAIVYGGLFTLLIKNIWGPHS